MPALANLTWPVRTERLLIRPFRDDDFPAVFGYRSLEEVARWLPGWPRDLDVMRASWTEQKVQERQLVIEHDGVLVGDLFVNVGEAWAQKDVGTDQHQAELGWCLDPAWHGRGLALEATTALLAICFRPAPAGLGVRRVLANCFADNEPSWRLMEKLGMRRESHTVRDGLHRSGEWLDGLTYALLAEEFLSR